MVLANAVKGGHVLLDSDGLVRLMRVAVGALPAHEDVTRLVQRIGELVLGPGDDAAHINNVFAVHDGHDIGDRSLARLLDDICNNGLGRYWCCSLCQG